MALTPIQEQIVSMKTMAWELVTITSDLEAADAQAVLELNGSGLTQKTYDAVKSAIDASHVKSMQYYGLSIIAHQEMAKVQPEPPEAPEGGGGGKTTPPWP